MIQPYNLPPVNPAAFGGLPKAPQGGQPPQGGPQPPMDMNKYLIDKVMEIKRRMGASGSVGALGAISDAMMQPQPQPQPPNPEQMRA